MFGVRALLQGRQLCGIAFLCLVGSGCGSSSGPKIPELGQVTGVVKLDGQPVKNALVTFVPENVRPATARTDDQGRYELTFNDKLKGTAVGMNTVRISARDESGSKGNMETIPEKYNAKTTLKKEVKAGKNEINFDDLTSK